MRPVEAGDVHFRDISIDLPEAPVDAMKAARQGLAICYAYMRTGLGINSRARRKLAVAAEQCLAVAGVARPGALLLLGHMRSGSTLLLHLLLTNPAIHSLGERNEGYSSSGDLARLAVETRLKGRSFFRPLRYVADQINHTKFTPVPELLRVPRVRVVFLLREPRSAISSLIELSRQFYENAWSADRAISYYVERLGSITALSLELSPQTATTVRYESLIAAPEAVLENLRIFLGLGQGFSTTYAAHPFTGSRGDPGEHIRAGRIVHTSGSGRDALAASQLAPAQESYERCCSALQRLAAESCAEQPDFMGTAARRQI